MSTKTDSLDDLPMELEDNVTPHELLEKLAEKQGWQPANDLLRLEGFSDPWERLIFKGRELDSKVPLAEQGVSPDAVLVAVRRVLIADGWKIAGPDDDSSDDEDTKF